MRNPCVLQYTWQLALGALPSCLCLYISQSHAISITYTLYYIEDRRPSPREACTLGFQGSLSFAVGVLISILVFITIAWLSPLRVWSWGWGVHGQLGLKTVDDKLLPYPVISLDRLQVSFIAAGYGHSAVLTSHGQVLTFGNGEHASDTV